jgi:hypothetical protein
VIGRRGFTSRGKSTRPSFWPLYAMLALVLFGVAQFLPAGYARAVLAAPTLILVPGSLTLGAVFGERSRPRGVAFFYYATLLGVICTVLVSLGLYLVDIRITPTSTYLGVLVLSAVLAAGTGARMWLEQTGDGRRVARPIPSVTSDVSDVEIEAAQRKTASRRRGKPYVLVALIWGTCLLAGAVVAYDHLPHPASPGYTYIAWTGGKNYQDVGVGSTGAELNFQIVNQQPSRDLYKLTAEWLSSPPRQLAAPMNLVLPVGQTFHGSLSVPPLPNGCTYRIVVELTAAGQINHVTGKPQTWSIDADVQDPSKPAKPCS